MVIIFVGIPDKENFQMSNGKFDTIIKLSIPALIAIFVAMFGFMVSDIREIRVNSQQYYSELHKQEVELAQLKLRVELLGVMPPTTSPTLSVDDLSNLMEILKNKK